VLRHTRKAAAIDRSAQTSVATADEVIETRRVHCAFWEVLVRIFLSYGHDRNTPIVLRIKQDLEAAGHFVWIDSSEIKHGDDWRRSILDGLMDTDWTLGFLSRHSVRTPGVCLDELGIALHVKGGTIATILVEAEAAADPPVSISQFQWLDMHDWAERMADPSEAESWYGAKFKEILSVLADPKTQRFAGEIEALDRLLRPIPQEAEIGALVEGFIGRQWLQAALDDWCKHAPQSRLFWISGPPGTGKSAFAAWLAHRSLLHVIGVNFCRYNVEERRDPARVLCTIVFQMATRLPDFRRLLLDRFEKEQEDRILDRKSIASLFDWLLVQPLRFAIDGGRTRERHLIVIDGLDETIRDGRSALAEVLAESCHKLPQWLGVVVTGRPEPSILRQFSAFEPQTIATESEQNLDDCRAYVGRWLAIESLGAGSTQSRVDEIVEASQGNFLYLRMLRDAVMASRMDIHHPDGLPQGLIGLYERWFRRQFPDAAAYQRVRPLLEVLVAANHPVPEQWLRRIFDWSPPEQAQIFESLGSLFVPTKTVGVLTETPWQGLGPFHKSLRDWLTDPHSAGADFTIDPAPGSTRMIAALWPAFAGANGRRKHRSSDLPFFVTDELMFQVGLPQCDAARRNEFISRFIEPEYVRRRMLIDTDANEDERRIARISYENLVEKIASAWSSSVDATVLSQFAEELVNTAWRSMEGRLDNIQDFINWLDVENPPKNIWHFKNWLDEGKDVQHPQQLPRMRQYYKQLTEWELAILVLVTAVRIATALARARTELVPCLSLVINTEMRDFINTGAHGAVSFIYQNTAGVDYLPERNMSFLQGEIATAWRDFKDDPRLAEWAKE
jgi:hypothetical protein